MRIVWPYGPTSRESSDSLGGRISHFLGMVAFSFGQNIFFACLYVGAAYQISLSGLIFLTTVFFSARRISSAASNVFPNLLPQAATRKRACFFQPSRYILIWGDVSDILSSFFMRICIFSNTFLRRRVRNYFIPEAGRFVFRWRVYGI